MSPGSLNTSTASLGVPPLPYREASSLKGYEFRKCDSLSRRKSLVLDAIVCSCELLRYPHSHFMKSHWSTQIFLPGRCHWPPLQHLLSNSSKKDAIVNFMCWLTGLRGAQTAETLFLDVFMRVFLERISIWIRRLIHFPIVGGPLPLLWGLR